MASAATFALDSTSGVYANLNVVPALFVQGSGTSWRIATAPTGGTTFSTVYASQALALAAIVTYIGTAVVL